MEIRQYLNYLLSWSQYVQQQVDHGLSPGRIGETEQLYTRLNYLIQEIEETIKRPYTLQHDDVLVFSSQANKLYDEIVGFSENSQIVTNVNKDLI